ncbi:MAG: hypothetical protein ACTHW5_01605 [Microbacterium sp.]
MQTRISTSTVGTGARGTQLCTVCRIARGHRHASPEDHLHTDGIACACGCHDQESGRPFTDDLSWVRVTLVALLIVVALRERGPPAALAA